MYFPAVAVLNSLSLTSASNIQCGVFRKRQRMQSLFVCFVYFFWGGGGYLNSISALQGYYFTVRSMCFEQWQHHRVKQSAWDFSTFSFYLRIFSSFSSLDLLCWITALFTFILVCCVKLNCSCWCWSFFCWEAGTEDLRTESESVHGL